MDVSMTATQVGEVSNAQSGIEQVPPQVAPVDNSTLLNLNLKPDIVGGYNIASQRAIFDRDDTNIIVASNRQLFYYDVKSYEQVGVAFVTSSKLLSDETITATDRLDNSLYVFTNHGRIFIWNLETRDWFNELMLPLEQNELLISCRMLSKRQYIYTILNAETQSTTINYSMSRSERERPKSRELIHECTSGVQNTYDIGCLVSPNNYAPKSDKKLKDKSAKQRCLTYIHKNEVYFQTLGIFEKLNIEHKKRTSGINFTCVRANQSRPLVAAGDTLGRIYVYTGDFVKQKVNRSKLHWHTMPVNDICFSSTGQTLFSVGGESGCVVIWDLTQNNLGQKRVVAHLGMPIRYISCGNNHNQLIMSFEDNEIQFMDTNYRTNPLKTFTRRTMDMYTLNDYKALRLDNNLNTDNKNAVGLLWHSKTDSVITNGKTGCLQFYSPKTKSKLECISFLKANILSLEKEARVVPSDITRATLTLDGNWIAFYETRDSDTSFPELHIWQRSSVFNRWNWVQTGERLHSSASIVDLKFSQDGQYLLSVSADGVFHILHRISLDPKSNNKQMYAKGFTGNVPEGLPSMGTFSHDSSVMAMSLKNNTCLIWMIEDPYKLVYECQLNQTESELDSDVRKKSRGIYSSNDVLSLNFGCHRPSQSIAPLCEVRAQSIRVWNILNPQETMVYQVKERCLDDDEFTAAAFDQSSDGVRLSDHYAVSTKRNLILLFKLEISQSTRHISPLIVIDGTLPFSSPNTIYRNMCFLREPILDIDPQCHHEFQVINLLNRLCLMNNRQELVSITDKFTLERRWATNSCNEIRTFEISDLQAYFAKSVSTYQEEINALPKSDKLETGKITEKQRKIRNRLDIQKMLRSMFTRIPSHNLPKMEILGPMILDKLT